MPSSRGPSWPRDRIQVSGTAGGFFNVCYLVAQSCPSLCNPMDCSLPGFPVLHYLLEFAQTHVHWVDDANQLSHPLSPPSPPALNLSQHQDLSNESTLRIGWPKYWSFSFSISPSNEYSGLISFRIDWFDLLDVQGTFKSLLQHHNSKVSTLWHSAFLMVQLTSIHDYWKNHSFDYMDLCWQWCLCFLTCCLGLSYLFFQGAFFNFVAIVTVCSDFGAQEFNQY